MLGRLARKKVTEAAALRAAYNAALEHKRKQQQQRQQEPVEKQEQEQPECERRSTHPW